MSKIGHTDIPNVPMTMQAYVEITEESQVSLYLADSGFYRILINGRVHPALVGMTKDVAQGMVDDFEKLQTWVRNHPHG